MYEQILDALRRNATGEALAAARERVTAQPEDPQAYRWLAAAQQQNAEAEAALASIDQAIALSPEDARLHLARAGLLLDARRTEAAQSALAQATEFDPNLLGTYVLQSQLALGRGDLDAAERQYQLAVRVAPNHPRLAAIEGMLALHRGDADRALRVITAGLGQLPDDLSLRYALGFAYMQRSNWAFAEQAFRSIVERNPSANNLRSLIADLLRRQGRPAEAAEALAPLLADPDAVTPGLQRFMAQMHLEAGQVDQAMPLLQAVLAAMPNDRDTLAALVDAWTRRGEVEVGRNTLDAALATTTDATHLWLARLALEPSGSPLELPLASRWVAAMPGSLPALEAQLEAYAAANQSEQAEAVAQQVLALSPGHSAAQAYLFNALLARDPRAAVAQARSLLGQSRNEQSRQLLLGWLGIALDKTRQHAEAVASWTERSKSLVPGQLFPHRISSPYLDWPPMAPLSPETTVRPLFLWGAPGSGVERVAAVLKQAGAPLLADRFRPGWPGDQLQRYDSIEGLGSGLIDGAAMVENWRAGLPARGIADGQAIDWLVWWDNAFLKAFRPYLADGLLLVVLRDPRDMLLQWLAFGTPSQMALPSPIEGAKWLAEMLGQVLVLSEEQLYPHFLVRLDGMENDPVALADAVGKTLRTPPLPAPPSLGPNYLRSGHWRDYADALADPFAMLTPAAVRLGYPET
ncbi:MAG TPA: tetratricopeptide repeat protein [Pseudoxanthomonas sp.]